MLGTLKFDNPKMLLCPDLRRSFVLESLVGLGGC